MLSASDLLHITNMERPLSFIASTLRLILYGVEYERTAYIFVA